jgi:hypothetical protein
LAAITDFFLSRGRRKEPARLPLLDFNTSLAWVEGLTTVSLSS